jgi:hypothetical protein
MKFLWSIEFQRKKIIYSFNLFIHAIEAEEKIEENVTI